VRRFALLYVTGAGADAARVLASAVLKTAMQRILPHLTAAILTLGLLAGFVFWPSKPAPPPVAAAVNTPPPPPVAPEFPKGWQAIAVEDAFTFHAPPGAIYMAGHGEDSLTGKISGPGFALQFDYGIWSSDLGFAAAGKNYSEADSVIDGRRLTIKKAEGIDAKHGGSEAMPYFVGLYIPVTVKPAGDAYPVKLSVTGFAATPKDAATIEQIYKTVRFSGTPP